MSRLAIEHLEQIEQQLVNKKNRKKRRMNVSGKRVFALKKIITKKRPS